MKLLFDQNLSFKLCARLSDQFPGSEHVRALGLDTADDTAVWQYAREHGFALVSMDSDMAELALLRGEPPKVVWLRFGNQPTKFVEQRLRRAAAELVSFSKAAGLACLELH